MYLGQASDQNYLFRVYEVRPRHAVVSRILRFTKACIIQPQVD
jgi:hypothetical protein